MNHFNILKVLENINSTKRDIILNSLIKQMFSALKFTIDYLINILILFFDLKEIYDNYLNEKKPTPHYISHYKRRYGL